jgi:hypothetical protein
VGDKDVGKFVGLDVGEAEGLAVGLEVTTSKVEFVTALI